MKVSLRLDGLEPQSKTLQEFNGRFFGQKHQALSVSDRDIYIDGMAVISKSDHRFVLRDLDDLQKVFGRTNFTNFETRLSKIAQLLNEGRQFEAIFLANIAYWGEDHPARKANFNSDELRDDGGRWTRDGSQPTNRPDIEDAQYRGFFHDAVVDDLLQGLAAKGSNVLKNVNVLGLNGIVAIPDGVSRPAQANRPYFIEVETGNDPGFTPNQKQVYPLICVGGHAVSNDPRITQLGLTPGVPFPPLNIVLVVTPGPGMPID